MRVLILNFSFSLQGRTPPHGMDGARLQQLAFSGKPGFNHGVPSLLVLREVRGFGFVMYIFCRYLGSFGEP